VGFAEHAHAETRIHWQCDQLLGGAAYEVRAAAKGMAGHGIMEGSGRREGGGGQRRILTETGRTDLM
jgi:hypothetical protein